MTRHPARWLFPFFAACAAAGAWSARALAADTDLTFRVDPAFTRSRLTTEEQRWYDLSWAHSAGCATIVGTRAVSDDLYTIGRSVGDYLGFMLMGLRATGDRRYLDRVMVVTDLMRTTLRDADEACVGGATDGFLNWRWKAPGYSCTNTGGFYGRDFHQLDEGMTHGNVAMFAYAFAINADIDTAYANRAAYWRNYLQNHWEAKWVSRVGGDRTRAWMDGAGMYKHEAHVVGNLVRAAYYLWKITGDPFYLARADGLEARCRANFVLNPNVPTAYSWHHQVDNTTTWQAINYSEYTAAVVCDLHFDGYTPYASTGEISRFMSTWRDIVLANSAPAFNSMTADVFGAGSIGIRASGISAFARWDGTGRLLAYANRFANDTPGANSISTIRAFTGAQVAVSTRGNTTGPDITPPARIQDLRME